MSIQVNVIMIGVEDIARAKKFYAEGLGCTVEQDFGGFVKLNLGEGSSSLALYEWKNAARDAGVSPEGSGFRGVSFHFIVTSPEAVDETISKAVAAGANVAKEVKETPWGRDGYFSDPDGHLWKVAFGS